MVYIFWVSHKRNKCAMHTFSFEKEFEKNMADEKGIAEDLLLRKKS